VKSAGPRNQWKIAAIHPDMPKRLGSRWRRDVGGDGLPLHPHRAQSRLKPGEPIDNIESLVKMILDLHVHTTSYSPCSVMSPDELAIAAKKAGLDGVCITEHNRVWKAEQAQNLSRRHGLAVFRGMEVTTTGGDILVFGLEEEPEGLVSPAWLKKKVDAAGAVAFAAHPFRGFLLFGFGALDMGLDDALVNPTFAHVHGLEVCNGRVTAEENDFARRVAEAMGLLGIGGSDAHESRSVGACVTRFEDCIEDERQLVEALASGRFKANKVK
jgi:predicted metal-dependent phosphoesterase TrpH